MTTEWPELAALGFPGRITCNSAPFQVEGEIEGAYWYFRARHDWVAIGMSRDSFDGAVEATIDGGWCVEGDDILDLGYNADPDDPWHAAYVRDFILECVRREPK
jgi:hypothetical protein